MHYFWVKVNLKDLDKCLTIIQQDRDKEKLEILFHAYFKGHSLIRISVFQPLFRVTKVSLKGFIETATSKTENVLFIFLEQKY